MRISTSSLFLRIAVICLGCVSIVLVVFFVLVGLACGDATDLSITYPFDGALFPPEIIAPEIRWEENNPHADRWRVTVVTAEADTVMAVVDTTVWIPNDHDWEQIKQRSLQTQAVITVESLNRVFGVTLSLASATVSIATSRDSVGAPIFYRDVPLPFRFAHRNVPLIRWRLGNIGSNEQAPTVLTNLPVCGNCHSFSADGRTLGMDVDVGNDKGAYAFAPFQEETILSRERLVSWSSFVRDKKVPTFGMLPRVSPDGRYVVAGVKDRVVFLQRDDLYFSQIFFPVKGILAYFDRLTGRITALHGADDEQYVQSNAVWTPDGEQVIFARSRAVQLQTENDEPDISLTLEESAEVLGGEEYLTNAQEGGKKFRFDLYRVPFNGGRGGTPQPIEGASNNGMSNFFPKVSPDGKWLVFTQSHSFMLLQPDSKLYIMPAAGGEPRLMNANTNRMNSWHSWSPNGRWLVFSSKVFSPYTQLFLTHIDENGNDTPPVLLRNFTAVDRAANIPEFVNIDPADTRVIREMFIDDYNYFRAGRLYQAFQEDDRAEEEYLKSLALNPDNTNALYSLASVYADRQDHDRARATLERVAELDPNNAAVHDDLGSMYFTAGEYDAARREFERAVALDPTNVGARFNLGTVLTMAGELPGAEAQFLRLLGLDISDNTAVRALLSLGRVYVTSRQFTEMAQVYRRVLSLDSTHADARYNLGIAYRALNDLPRARREFEALVRMNPDNVDARNELGRVLAQTGDFRSAVREFEHVLEQQRGNAFAQIHLGNLYYELRRFDDAENVLNDLIGADPNNVAAHVTLGRVLGEKRRFAQAAEEFNIALRTSPTDSRVYFLLGEALSRNDGTISEAIAAYENGLRLDARNREAHMALAAVYLRAGDLQAALGQYQNVLQLNPPAADRTYIEAQMEDLRRRLGTP